MARSLESLPEKSSGAGRMVARSSHHPGRTLMRPPVVKGQRYPLSGFFAFFPPGGCQHQWPSATCSDLVSHAGAQRGCTKHLLRFARHVHDECRNPSVCFLRPRNISVPSYRPRPRQDKRQTFSSEGAGSGEEQHTVRVDNLCRMVKPVPTGHKKLMRKTCVISPPCDGGVKYGIWCVVRARAQYLGGRAPA